MLKAFPTQVKLVFRQYPLESHSQAALAAAAALAAHKQGKFWPLHDAMFAAPAGSLEALDHGTGGKDRHGHEALRRRTGRPRKR